MNEHVKKTSSLFPVNKFRFRSKKLEPQTEYIKLIFCRVVCFVSIWPSFVPPTNRISDWNYFDGAFSQSHGRARDKTDSFKDTIIICVYLWEYFEFIISAHAQADCDNRLDALSAYSNCTPEQIA